MLNKNKKLSGVFAGSLLSFICAHSWGQQLEEVLVTAQVRSESLQDVSVSVSALSGDLMAEQGIARVEDFVAYIPNFSFSETGIGTNIYIRGIGSGINQGFEQSVGMYKDGIYYGRAQLTRAPIFDMERVEVLRGPQITLFGNNSVGGALSLITRNPDQEPEASVSLLYEPDHGEKEGIVILSGALTDTFSARLAHRSYELDGYIENRFLDQDEPQRDYDTTRLTLAFEPSDSFDTTLKLEKSNFDVIGRQIRVFKSLPSVGQGASGQNYAVNNPVTGLTLAEILASFNSVGGATVADPSNSDVRYSNGDSSENESQSATLSFNWAMENGYTLTSILGYLDYQYDEVCDCDFTSALIVPLESAEEYDQQSIEIRLTSPGGEKLDFIAGLYYQKDNLEFEDSLFALPRPSGFVDLLEGIPLTASAADLLSGKAVPRAFSQDNESAALFAEFTWHLSDFFRLNIGARHTHTEKTARRQLTYTEIDGSPADEATLDSLDLSYGIVFRAFRHDLSGSREEQRTGYNLTAEWDAHEDLMLYASYKNGFKPGGFDVRSNAPPELEQVLGNPLAFNPDRGGSFEFNDEHVKAFELGAKISLNQAAEINIAYYYTEINDLQVSVFDGALGFNVSNAAEAVSQGLELDARWAIDENWYLSGSIGFMDFEFKDYPQGLCTSAEQLETAITGIDPDGDPQVQGADCDVSFDNRTNQYVADYSGSLSLGYETNLTDNLLLNWNIDLLFTDDYNPSQNLDPVVQQDAYEKVNLRFAISNMDRTWEIALLGKNVTDEEVITYANDVPLSTSQFGTSTYYGFYDRPAYWAIQVKYSFL